jgi:outer membrane lipoprotein-sorting protein
MKKIYLLLIACVCLQFSFAQNDAKAKKILDEVSSKIKTYKGISANFTIKIFTSKGKPNGVKTGMIYLKGNKYNLQQDKTEIICDGTKVYNYDGNKTITVSGIEESNQTLSPQNLLTDFYDKDFTYKLVSSTSNFNEIELIPIDKKKNFQKVNLFINKSTKMITKAKITDKSSNIIEFGLSNIKYNAIIPDKLFVFDKNKYPDDVEMLD